MRKSCKPSAYAPDYAMAPPYLQVLLYISSYHLFTIIKLQDKVTFFDLRLGKALKADHG